MTFFTRKLKQDIQYCPGVVSVMSALMKQVIVCQLILKLRPAPTGQACKESTALDVSVHQSNE